MQSIFNYVFKYNIKMFEIQSISNNFQKISMYFYSTDQQKLVMYKNVDKEDFVILLSI